MEFLMDFNSQDFNQDITKFLIDNLRTKTEKATLQKLIRGNKIQLQEATQLLKRIVAAMIFADSAQLNSTVIETQNELRGSSQESNDTGSDANQTTDELDATIRETPASLSQTISIIRVEVRGA